VPEPPTLEFSGYRTEQGVHATEFRVRANRACLHFVEVQSPNRGTTTLALPLALHTQAETCLLAILGDRDELRPVAFLAPAEGYELVASYMESGSLQEATDILHGAEEMLFYKLSNPMAAALGGYALLRCGELERLHDWPDNLAASVRWLPDGAVIAGELAARQGDHPKAVDSLLTAADRGLPLFTEGMSILVSRFRHYSMYGMKIVEDQERLGRISGALETMNLWAFAADQSALLLTLRDMSLTETGDEDVATPEPAEGWQLFDPPEDPEACADEDCWSSEF
jgi:hypothetical protein